MSKNPKNHLIQLYSSIHAEIKLLHLSVKESRPAAEKADKATRKIFQTTPAFVIVCHLPKHRRSRRNLQF